MFKNNKLLRHVERLLYLRKIMSFTLESLYRENKKKNGVNISFIACAKYGQKPRIEYYL